MISAGNDIVSFAETNPVRSTLPAFYKKFVKDSELVFFDALKDDDLPFDRFIWLLWSVKEASFKYLHRHAPELIFSPSRFVVSDLLFQSIPNGVVKVRGDLPEFKGNFIGQVVFDGTTLRFQSSICADYVHSVIIPSNNNARAFYGVKHIANNSHEHQSAKVREFCYEQLSITRFKSQFSFIQSSQNVPSVLDAKSGTTYPVSFSHHGRFVAYSF